MQSTHLLELVQAFDEPDMSCQRCASLDVDALFRSDAEYKPPIRQIQDLGTLEPPLWQPSCSICRLLKSAKVTFGPETGKALYKLFSGPPPVQFQAYLTENIQRPVLYVVDEAAEEILVQEHGRYSQAFKDKIDLFITLEDHSASESSTLQRQFDDDGSINFELIKGWLQICKRDHTLYCRKSRSFRSQALQDFSVVDCQTRKIVPMRSECEYVALSYVWGDRHLPVDADFLGDKYLSKTLPKTIEDAILVSSKLGIPYIWIDRYCIEQEDGDKKVRQINNMDVVFKEAAVVLVAVAGSDPTHGLPGVSTVSRPARSRAWMGSKELIASRPDVIQTIRSSRWSSRAWTFQEAYFATTVLCFTDHEIYYECAEMTARESLVEPIWIHPILLFERRVDQLSMWPDIRKYNGRDLTYDDDALRAFAGVFHDYSLHKPYPMTHHVGIPIVPMTYNWIGATRLSVNVNGQQSFISGLCWANKDYATRREGYPSWSWAGWKTTIIHNAFPADAASYLDGDEPPKVFVEDANGQPVDFESHIATTSALSRLETFTRYIHIEAWTVQINTVNLKGANPVAYDSSVTNTWTSPSDVSPHIGSPPSTQETTRSTT